MISREAGDHGSFQSIIEQFKLKRITMQEAEALLDGLKKRARAAEKSSSAPTVEAKEVNSSTIQESSSITQESSPTMQSADIAVVGMAGRFPDAGNVDTFWKNLERGHNGMRLLPERYLKPVISREESYRWGGIVEDRDCFDPLFFNITPREAKSMNPHQRVIMEESWKALEDAGYNPRDFAGSRLAIFVGAEPTGYYFESFTGFSDAIIASRLSYFLNLHGPAMVVNTGCSSSGVAIHLACESLRNRETDIALSGGVFAMMDQSSLRMMAKVGMLSPTGRCRTFDESGDGTVISEGVGMVLLKRLEDAIADHDNIHGVICASGVNQDGASNGITAPSGIAQTLLIRGVYKRFNINPEEITYVEAHGTGTRLGDPVEGNALVQAFSHFTEKRAFCAVGSAKSHIGHTGAAAGVTSLIKVLLSMKHEKMPGLINFDRLNPLIEFDNSPFYINTITRRWERRGDTPYCAAINSFGHSGTNAHLVVKEYLPKREKVIPHQIGMGKNRGPYLIPLSAKTPDALQSQAENILEFLKKEVSLKKQVRGSDNIKESYHLIEQVACTLQTGREQMKKRLILLVRDMNQLIEKLTLVCRGESEIEDLWRYREKKSQTQTLQKGTADLPPSFEIPATLPHLRNMAQIWAEGISLDFNQLYSKERPARISIPTYPFARERYWIPEPDLDSENALDRSLLPSGSFTHPLVHRNSATLKEHRFSSIFTGEEFFLADHRIKGVRILPGMAYLEMAREAVLLSAGTKYRKPLPITLKNIIWARAISIDPKPVEVHIRLTDDGNDQTGFEIYSIPENRFAESINQENKNPDKRDKSSLIIVHSRGVALPAADRNIIPIDIHAVRSLCNLRSVSGKECYEIFRSMGVEYGPAHMGIDTLYIGSGQVLARLELSEEIFGTDKRYILHTGLMDAAIQSSIGLIMSQTEGVAENRLSSTALMKPALPFALDRIDIIRPCTRIMWVWIRPSTGNGTLEKIEKLDMDLCDMEGAPVAVIRGFSARRAYEKGSSEKSAPQYGLNEKSSMPMPETEGNRDSAQDRVGLNERSSILMLKPFWQERCSSTEPALNRGEKEFSQHWIFLLAPPDGISSEEIENRIMSRIINRIRGVRCRDITLSGLTMAEEFTSLAMDLFDRIKQILQKKPTGNILVQAVVFTDNGPHLFSDGISGMLKSAALENPKFTGQVVEMELATDTGLLKRPQSDQLIHRLMEERKNSSDSVVQYWNKRQRIRKIREIDPFSHPPLMPWKDGGVYLITGGFGGLGLIFAEEIASQTKGATLILTGRSSLDQINQIDRRIQARVNSLSLTDTTVEYHQVDTTDKDALSELISYITKKFSTIDGILHTAGVIRDNFIIKKPLSDMEQVLSPKVSGVALLDLATKDMKLDFFILFSSIAGFSGGSGQADYAAANGFMNAYAEHRESLHQEGKRYGRTISICWPLWRDGGMGIDPAAEKIMNSMTGIHAMESQTGIDAFYRIFAQKSANIMVVAGELPKIREYLSLSAEYSDTTEDDLPSSGYSDSAESDLPLTDMITEDELQQRVLLILTEASAEALDVLVEDMEIDGHFIDYGFDPVMFSMLLTDLNRRFNLSLTMNLYFEYPSLNALAGYLATTYEDLFLISFHARLTSSQPDDKSNDRVKLFVAGHESSSGTANSPDRVEDRYELVQKEELEEDGGGSSGDEDGDDFKEQALEHIRRQIASAIDIQLDRLDPDTAMEEYGIDSIMAMELTLELEKSFGSLPKTLFFEYLNIRDLTGYFLKEYHEKLREILPRKISVSSTGPKKESSSSAISAKEYKPHQAQADALPFSVENTPSVHHSMAQQSAASIEPLTGQSQPDEISSDIAIIGLSGRYPKSGTINQFWQNLKAGADCITGIPEDRWDHSPFFDADRDKPGKTYAKWGGFIDDADKFDPLFFNISPQEAIFRDPQERLYLECVQETLEDAGYTRESLKSSRYGGLIGVYVGVMYEEYQLYGAQEQVMGNNYVLSGSQASIANRISYFYDFNGPSMAVDTMCSSSLTAIHLACQSLKQKECAMALAGGVNLSIHPNKFLMLGQGRLASSDGLCRSFGKGGDGYVPGEGVGAVLLKPLLQAVEDGDHIYGIIRGSAINHGGKTNGFSVPNPKAQAAVISRAFKNADIHPRTISFIETHGTGTALGDPIEVAGLTRAFEEQTTEKQFCAISSAKSNIGHCEGAAGIAGLTKVLLQMKYGLLVPSIHSESPNPNIDFAGSPFLVQQKLSPWRRPVINMGKETREYPRIAGISSFGAGGSNAHLIVEEYMEKEDSSFKKLSGDNRVVILLSAKKEDALMRQASRLKEFIEEQPLTDEHLEDMAYTLQVGREHYSHRLAFTACSMKEVVENLTKFSVKSGSTDVDGKVFIGTVARKNHSISMMESDEDMAGTIEAWILKRKYDRLLSLWVQGLHVDWSLIYPDRRPRRISLPAYPFEKNRYWIGEKSFQVPVIQKADFLHPLIHENISDFYQQQFRSTFTGNEIFLKDHKISGEPVLPGTACLEMAREAVCRAMGTKEPICLKDLAWITPVIIHNTPVTVYISLSLERDDNIRFEIYSNIDSTGESLLHCRGNAALISQKETDSNPYHLEAARARCNEGIISSKECYDAFDLMGISYGLSHQGIETIYLGRGEALAKLALPDPAPALESLFFLSPGMMDSALQSATGLIMGQNGTAHPSFTPGVPFALDRMEIIGKTVPFMWASARFQDNGDTHGRLQKIDIDLIDDRGEICVRIRGFSTRPLQEKAKNLQKNQGPVQSNVNIIREGTKKISSAPEEPDKAHPDYETVLFTPTWKREPVDSNSVAPPFARHLIFLWDMGSVQLPAQSSLMEIESLNPEDRSVAENYRTFALRIFERIKSIIINREAGETLIQVVMPSISNNAPFTGVSGLLRSAAIENPHIRGQIIEVSPVTDMEELVATLKENSFHPHDSRIRYHNGERMVAGWQRCEAPSISEDNLFRDHGTYLITGGAGGLGLIFAKEILSRAPDANLILTGRSDPDEKKMDQLKALQAGGATLRYLKADVSDRQSVADLIRNILSEFGSLNGIIHSAGIISDNFILKKSSQEFTMVLAPKVDGVCCLDQATEDLDLDLFALFSSGSGVMGNAGQADYATANAFMDGYALYRNTLVNQGERRGRTLSINWPLWEDGGMQVADETRELMVRHTGAIPMRSESGIAAFYQGVALGQDQVMVLEGEAEKLEALFSGAGAAAEAAEEIPDQLQIKKARQSARNFDTQGVEERLTSLLKECLSMIIKLPVDQIETDVPFDEYGIDSIMVMNFISMLEERFGSLSKTLVFEYENIQELARYFMESHEKEVASLFQTEMAHETEVEAEVQAYKISSDERRRVSRFSSAGAEYRSAPREDKTDRTVRKYKQNIAVKEYKHNVVAKEDEQDITDREDEKDIAVIGISGRYPESANIDIFWENLKSGVDCITNIPKERWDNSLFFDENRNRLGRIYTEWGGFIDGVDLFDPLFFDIPEREAEWTDPKERLFLETVWNLFESSGYTRKSLTDLYNGKVGVWVGSMSHQYHFAAQDEVKQSVLSVLASHSYIANRVSYFYDFQGPSMAIDTKCSSSLTAVHLACESLIKKECRLAVAGGVNLTLHPNNYLGMCNLNMIGSDHNIRSFGDGDGFIPSEGVGAVLLKPLSAAIRDGDNILAVIKSSLINHGGQTRGFTNPDPKSHMRLIMDNLKKSNIDPRTITYVESSATGSAPNDLAEISAMNKAFRQYTRDLQFCAIGSVKSNIGHAEAASGISQLTKVILQLKHKTLVPTIKADPLNPDIKFESSPFFLQHTLGEWEQPVMKVNGELTSIPRRAAVNSFGMGGSNAHLILEEYVEEYVPETQNHDDSQDSHGKKRRTINLYTSPFSKKRYWIAPVKEEENASLIYTPDQDKSTLENIAFYLKTIVSHGFNRPMDQIAGSSGWWTNQSGQSDQRFCLKLMRLIEEQLLLKITEQEMLENDTIDSLSELLSQKTDRRTDRKENTDRKERYIPLTADATGSAEAENLLALSEGQPRTLAPPET